MSTPEGTIPVFIDTERMIAHILEVVHDPDQPAFVVNGFVAHEGITDNEGNQVLKPVDAPLAELPPQDLIA